MCTIPAGYCWQKKKTNLSLYLLFSRAKHRHVLFLRIYEFCGAPRDSAHSYSSSSAIFYSLTNVDSRVIVIRSLFTAALNKGIEPFSMVIQPKNVKKVFHGSFSRPFCPAALSLCSRLRFSGRRMTYVLGTVNSVKFTRFYCFRYSLFVLYQVHSDRYSLRDRTS